MGLEILGLIPARKGSKGAPRKNVRPVGGKPLVAWSWEAARSAPSITRLAVSTDDPEAAELARAAGVEVPFMRPTELASDTASALDVILHALALLQERERYLPDFVLWLQPTSPMRTTGDIEASVALLREKSADSVIGVSPAFHHPLWMKRLDAEGRLLPLEGGAEPPDRRQDLPTVYQLNGAIYLTRREVLQKGRTFYPESTYGYVMPPERSLEVDSLWDLYLADLVLRDRVQSGRD